MNIAVNIELEIFGQSGKEFLFLETFKNSGLGCPVPFTLSNGIQMDAIQNAPVN